MSDSVGAHLRQLAQAFVKSIVVLLVTSAISWALAAAQARFSGTGIGLPLRSRVADCVTPADKIGVRFDQVGGHDAIKDDLRHTVVLPLRHARVFFDEALALLRPPRGVLFAGPPGTGKTLMAQALAHEAGVPLIHPGLADIENKYYGESSKILASVFATARALQPCVVFFDEIDGMMRKRGDEDQSCVYSLKTEFLAQMDGVHNGARDQFVVIGCTNNAGALDPALRRRMRKTYEFGVPDAAQRRDILRVTPGVADALGDDEIDRLAARSEGLSGSDIKEAVAIASALRLRRCVADASFQRSLAADDVAAVNACTLPVAQEEWDSAFDEVRRSAAPTDAREDRAALLTRALETLREGPPRPPDPP